MNIKIKQKNMFPAEVWSYVFIIMSLSPYTKIWGFKFFIVFLFGCFILILFKYPTHVGKKLLEHKYINSYIWPFYLFCNYLIGRTSGVEVIVAMIFITVGLIACVYQELNILSSLKRAIGIGVLYCLSVNVITVWKLFQYPLISRQIADLEMLKKMGSPFLAGYDYIYAGSLLVLALIVIILHEKRNSILDYLLCISFILLIVKSKYTFAILFTLISGCWLLLTENRIQVKSYKIEKLLIPVIIGVIFLSFPMILNLLTDIFGGVNSQVGSRIHDVYNLIFGEKIKSADGNERLRVYLLSLNTWKENLWFGIGKTTPLVQKFVGGHSDVFDILACYGTLGGIAFGASIFNMYKSNARYLNKEYKRPYSFIVMVFFAYMLINPIFDTTEIFIVFYLIPLLFIAKSKNKT